MTLLLIAFLGLAEAKPVAAPRLAPARVYIPDDSDPCDFERFKADSYLREWVRVTAPNTARAARCYHTPAKILPALSNLFGKLDKGALKMDGGAKIDLRAAALAGYQVDSVIDVDREGKRSVGLVFKSGTNGPAASQVYSDR